MTLVTTPARACAGPCATPELWQASVAESETFVLTNFGLLRGTEGQPWQLICEETIGGLVYKAEMDARSRVVLTDRGLFDQSGAACEWGNGAAGIGVDWIADFSLSRDGDQAAQEGFALAIDAVADQTQLLRAPVGEPFELLHLFDRSAGYGQVSSAGSPPSVFVSGYTYQPRAWHVAFSLDGSVDFDEASIEQPEGATSVIAVAADPIFSHKLYLTLQTPSTEPWQLLVFDADTQELSTVLTLAGVESFGGLAFTDDAIWVAGRDMAGASLYRASRDGSDFSRVVSGLPPLACLAERDGALYACAAFVTRDTPFLVGRSWDGGETFEPILTLEDLGKVTSCGAECDSTQSWMESLFGATPKTDAGSDSSGGGCAFHGRAKAPPGHAGLWLSMMMFCAGTRVLGRLFPTTLKLRPGREEVT